MGTLNKKILRDIWKNKAQFITIFLMTFLAIFAFAGIHGYMDGMTESARVYYENQNLQDLWITSKNITDEKLEEIKKISGLSNLLKLIGGLNETIILIRDVSAKKESYTPDQIKNDLVMQQKLFIKAIYDFFGNKLNKKEANCEILPNYELAKYNENYALAYKEQMKSLISTILIKIKKNNMDGNTFIEILKLLMDIFKNVEGLNKITDINIAINQIFKEIFERKVIKAYNEIKNKIYDKNIINFENFEREDIQNLLMNFVKIEIKDNLYKKILQFGTVLKR